MVASIAFSREKSLSESGPTFTSALMRSLMTDAKFTKSVGVLMNKMVYGIHYAKIEGAEDIFVNVSALGALCDIVAGYIRDELETVLGETEEIPEYFRSMLASCIDLVSFSEIADFFYRKFLNSFVPFEGVVGRCVTNANYLRSNGHDV